MNTDILTFGSFYQLKQCPMKLAFAETCALCRTTRGLIEPFVEESHFSIGLLDVSISKHPKLHTIFSKYNQGKVPYLAQDLAKDITNCTLDRQTINLNTENTIKFFAENISKIPATPSVVLITDKLKSHFLFLEGNKRLSGFALSGNNLNTKIETYFGKSHYSWSQILVFYGMSVNS